MIDRPVILGFTPLNCVSLGGSAWSVTAFVDDPLEVNDGWAVATGDVVYLDQRSSTTAPGTVGRYEVRGIVNKSSRQVGVALEWAAAGAAISPEECLTVRGYLAQPVDAVGTIEHPIQQTILIPQEMIDLAKRVELYAIGGEAEESEEVRTFQTAEALEEGQLVHVTPAGMAVLCSPQDPMRMPAAGIVLEQSGNQVRVRVAGIALRVTSGLIPGLPVFVGDGGLPITDPAGITLPAAVQSIGVALDSSTVSLAITGQFVKRA